MAIRAEITTTIPAAIPTRPTTASRGLTALTTKKTINRAQTANTMDRPKRKAPTANITINTTKRKQTAKNTVQNITPPMQMGKNIILLNIIKFQTAILA
jgi:hypothetical protein